jgi:parallel beta-helix repeat protein
MKSTIVTFVLLSVSHVISGQQFYVATTGNDTNQGTEQSPFKTITKALNAANPGAEIILRTGIYSEAIKIQKTSITIRSFTGEKAVIQTGNVNGSPDQTIWFQAKGGKLLNLEVIGGFYYAVKFETGDGLIKNCRIHDSGRDCIKIVPGANNITIENCEIYNSGIRDNSNAEGIDNVNGDDFTLRECYIHNTGTTGVYVKGGGRKCLIERNLITNAGNAGVLLGFYTDEEFYREDGDSDTNPNYYGNIDGVVRNNIILDTEGPGIGLFASSNSKVYNNTLIRVAKTQRGGIHLEPLNDDNIGAPTMVVNPFIVNNIVVTSSSRPTVEFRPLDGNAASGTIIMNNNLYHRTNGSLTFSINGAGGKNFNQWKTDTGYDVNSLTGDPQLDANYHLASTSSVIGKALVVADNLLDYDRGTRSQPFDIGADESDTGCPNVAIPPSSSVIGTIGICDNSGNPGDPGVITDLVYHYAGVESLIYPVPAQHSLFIKDMEGISEFMILDMKGITIIRSQLIKTSIDVSSLPAGIYFMVVRRKNQSTDVFRFFKME